MAIREERVEISSSTFHPAATIVYYEYGNSNSGKPVVLCVHGLSRNGRDFDELAFALSNDYRVISVDMPGRGKSPWLQEPKDYNYANYVGWLSRFLDTLGITKVYWIGTSMGGIIGLIMAATQSKRIEKLVLNDVGALVPKEGLKRISEYLGTVVLRDTKEEIESYLRKSYASFGIENETLWQHFFENSIRITPEGTYGLTFDPAIIEPIRAESKKFSEFKDVDLWALWNKATCPTLIIRGMLSDILLPATALNMRDKKPNTELYEVSGVGHAPSLMSNEQIEVVKRWLEKSQTAAPTLIERLKGALGKYFS